MKEAKQSIDGWLIIDKPLGISSTAVVGRARRLLSAKKVGHAGTLDPMASGMLVLAFGEATKLVEIVMRAPKSYRFSVMWGQERDTMDIEGTVTMVSDYVPTRTQIEEALSRFMPGYMQTPPKYSAVKIAGKRAYDMARSGEEFEIAPKAVELHNAQVVGHRSEDGAWVTDFEITCGKGFYVRSLARDIALEVGSACYVCSLRRTQSGNFKESDMILLAKLEEMVYKGQDCNEGVSPVRCITPLVAALDDILVWQVSPEDSKVLKVGRSVAVASGPMERDVVAVCGHVPVAVCTLKSGFLVPKRVLNLT